MATGSRLASRLIGTRIITGGEQTMNSLTLLTPAHTRRRAGTVSSRAAAGFSAPEREPRRRLRGLGSERHAGRMSSTS